MSPKFASFHEASAAHQNGDRSLTPYLGDDAAEDEEPKKRAETHQLLMMTASSITPMSIDNDNDS